MLHYRPHAGIHWYICCGHMRGDVSTNGEATGGNDRKIGGENFSGVVCAMFGARRKIFDVKEMLGKIIA